MSTLLRNTFRPLTKSGIRLQSNSPYGKTHLKAAPRVPRTLIPHFPQLVILSDGSSFTHTTTSPRSVFRLTRDVRNNSLWSPGSDRNMDGDDSSGRVGRFKKRFGAEMEGDLFGESKPS